MRISRDSLSRVVKILDLPTMPAGIAPATHIGIKSQKGGIQLCLSSDLSVQVTLEGQEPLTLPTEGLAVDRRAFMSFLNNSPLTSDYEFSMKEVGVLLIKQGSRHAKLQLTKPDWDYGEWPLAAPDMVLELTRDLLSILRCARICASDQPIVPQLNVVYVDINKALFVFSTNDLVACLGRCSYQGAGKVLLPNNFIDILDYDNLNRVLVKGLVVGLEMGTTRIWAQAPEEASTLFPIDQLKKILVETRKTPVSLTCSAEALSHQCRVFCGYLSGAPKTDWVMRLSGSKGKNLELVAETSYAKFKDSMEANVLQPSVKAQLNLDVMTPILELITKTGGVIELTATPSLCHIKTGHYEFLMSQQVEEKAQ